MPNGKIIVIITTYSRADNLPGIVESIKKQTYKNWRIFISDDRGTSNAEPIAREIIANNPDLDIAYFKNSVNLGEVNNLVAALSKNDGLGEFVVPFQDDCVYLDDQYFERAVEALNKDNRVKLVMGKIVRSGKGTDSWWESQFRTGMEVWQAWPIVLLWAGGIYRYADFYQVMAKEPAKNGYFGDSIAVLRTAFRGGVWFDNSFVIEVAYNKKSSPYAYFRKDGPATYMKRREAYYKELSEDARRYGASEEDIKTWLFKVRYLVANEALYEIKQGGCDEKQIDEWITALFSYDRDLTDSFLKRFVENVTFTNDWVSSCRMYT